MPIDQYLAQGGMPPQPTLLDKYRTRATQMREQALQEKKATMDMGIKQLQMQKYQQEMQRNVVEQVRADEQYKHMQQVRMKAQEMRDAGASDTEVANFIGSSVMEYASPSVSAQIFGSLNKQSTSSNTSSTYKDWQAEVQAGNTDLPYNEWRSSMYNRTTKKPKIGTTDIKRLTGAAISEFTRDERVQGMEQNDMRALAVEIANTAKQYYDEDDDMSEGDAYEAAYEDVITELVISSEPSSFLGMEFGGGTPTLRTKGQAPSEIPLPEGLTEEDVATNMSKYGVTRQEVIDAYLNQ